MILTENRFPLFGIMLTAALRPKDEWCCGNPTPTGHDTGKSLAKSSSRPEGPRPRIIQIVRSVDGLGFLAPMKWGEKPYLKAGKSLAKSPMSAQGSPEVANNPSSEE